MISRCTDPRDKNYPEVGALGISFYSPWADYNEFLKDLGERPEGTFLSRIRKDKNFEPGNVVWEKKLNTKEHDLYCIWREMKTRCGIVGDKQPANYASKGINLCDRWLVFSQFAEDMGPRPSKEYSIDRINNSKGYFKENCRWATRQEQANNTDANVRIEINGKNQTLSEWARELGINRATMQVRFDAIFCPPKPRAQKIGRLDKEGELEKIYQDVSHASDHSGVSQAAIRKCLCGHNKTAGGFTWVYLQQES